jgi:nucleoside-diphosphate-sugar epimerase
MRTDSSAERLSSNQEINIIRIEPAYWSRAINEIAPDALIMLEWEGVGNKDRNSEVQYSNLERVQSFVTDLRPIPQVIGVGSQAELGPRNDAIFDNDLSRPTTDYGRAKCKCRDFLIDHYKNTDTNFKWARIFSTYGALDSGDWLIPNLMKSLNADRPFQLTDGTQEWNYLHAYDAANAFKAMLTAGGPGIYNVGHTKTDTIRDVCVQIATIMGKDPQLLKFGSVPMRPDQVFKMLVDTSNLKRIGWKPRVNLTEGLSHTVHWICNGSISPIILNDGTEAHLANFSS